MAKYIQNAIRIVTLAVLVCGIYRSSQAETLMNTNGIVPSKLLTKIDPKSAPADSFQMKKASTEFNNGIFAYICFLSSKNNKGEVQWQPYLFIQEVNGNTQYKLAYRINTYERAYDPEISPNGQYILFKIGGYGSMDGGYRIFILNRKNHKVMTGPRDLAYPILPWSPNSSYFAYIRGGDIEGANGGGSLKLYTYSIKSDRSRFVADLPIISTMRWTPENTLLYCIKEIEDTTSNPPTSEIRETDPQTGESHTIIKQGEKPCPSSDGEYIAYIGLSQSSLVPDNKDNVKAKNSTDKKYEISILNRQTGKTRSYPVPALNDKITEFAWSLDNTKIYFLTSITASPNATVQVNELNFTSHKVKMIGMVKATDFEKIPRLAIFPQIQLMHQVHKNNFLYFKKEEDIGSDPPLYIEVLTIFAFNPSNGDITEGAKIKNSMGIAWWNASDKSTFTSSK